MTASPPPQPGACLVTGASGGIGSALCAEFQKAGWFVVATGSEGSAPDGLAHDAWVQADLAAIASEASVRAAFRAAVMEAVGERPFRALVNNAARQILGGTEDLSVEQLRASFDINAVAPFALVQLFLSELRANAGVVLNIGTVHARSTKSGFVAYAASKTALHGLTRALAVDLGPDVRVNTLAPAATATPMLRAGFEGNPNGFATLADAHPLGRIAEPAEIARTALFLVGPDSGFISGATLYADGGVLSRLHDPA